MAEGVDNAHELMTDDPLNERIRLSVNALRFGRGDFRLNVGRVGLFGLPVWAGEATCVTGNVNMLKAFNLGCVRWPQSCRQGILGSEVLSSHAGPVIPGMKRIRSAAMSPPSVCTLLAVKPLIL